MEVKMLLAPPSTTQCKVRPNITTRTRSSGRGLLSQVGVRGGFSHGYPNVASRGSSLPYSRAPTPIVARASPDKPGSGPPDVAGGSSNFGRHLSGVFVGALAIFLASGLGYMKTAKALEERSIPESVTPIPNELLETIKEQNSPPSKKKHKKVSSRALRAKEKADMLRAVRKKLDEDPTSVVAHKALLLIYMQNGDFKEAIQVLDKLIKMKPEGYDLLYMRARAYDMAGDVKKARKEFESLAKIQPFSAKVLQGLVFSMQKLGENHTKILQVVQGAIENAVEQNQTLAARDFKMLLGQVLIVQKNLTEALAQYEELVKDDPEDFRPYLCQALLYSSMGQTAEANKLFDKCKELCPETFSKRKYFDELLLRGELGLEQKEYEKRGSVAMQKPKAWIETPNQ